MFRVAGIDLSEIVVDFSYDEIDSVWSENKHWQRA